MNGSITEVNKDTFWELIAQAKEHPGGPSEWLMERLMDLGPEQAKAPLFIHSVRAVKVGHQAPFRLLRRLFILDPLEDRGPKFPPLNTRHLNSSSMGRCCPGWALKIL